MGENEDFLIAEFLGLKLGYMETFEDVSTEDDLNYKWKSVCRPFIYTGQLPKDECLDWISSQHYKNFYRKNYEGYNDALDYGFKYSTSLDALAPVMDKIEKMEYPNCPHSNSIVVGINGKNCEIYYTGYETGTLINVEGVSRVAAVYLACIKFIKLYNNNWVK